MKGGNMDCIHEAVCRHKEPGEECPILICKFYRSEVGVVEVPGKKQRKKDTPGRERSDYSNLTTSKKDIAKARAILKQRRKRGSLTTEQSAALKRLDGRHYKNLSEGEREQILSILRDTN